MIVMTIVGILVSMAIPIYQKSVIRARESVLRQNLFTLRTVIDEYTYDKTKAPQSLDDLVREGYLRQVPIDP
jgi:general secretion pathway protein G